MGANRVDAFKHRVTVEDGVGKRHTTPDRRRRRPRYATLAAPAVKC
jgi:hypothetical protein